MLQRTSGLALWLQSLLSGMLPFLDQMLEICPNPFWRTHFSSSKAAARGLLTPDTTAVELVTWR